MALSTNFISGLSSGINWSTMVDNLIAIDHQRVDLISNQKSDYEAKLAAWQSFNTKLLALKTASDSLKNPDDFGMFTSSMTTDSSTVKGSDLMTVTASSTASIGSYQIEVTNLAMAEKVRSVTTYADASATLGSSYAGDILINGETVSIDATDTLSSVLNKINNANTGASPTGVTATIIKYGASDYRLTLTSDTTGAAGILLQNGGAQDILSLFNFTEVVNGLDASFSVDGVPISQSSNTVDDVIAGATIDLLKADTSTTVTININRDIDSIKSKIQNFVSKYNDVASYINTQNSYDADTKKTGGVLFGDGTLFSVKSDLTAIVTQSVWGVNSQFSIMGLAGINLDKTGQLSINDTTLTGYLQTNFNDIMSLFTAQGITSSSSLSYTGNTQNSKSGLYTVHIDTAASRITSTSNTAVGGALGSDETLTITEGSKTATISLTSTMTISDIINAINAETDAVYTQTLAGSQQLKQDDNVTPITSETTWDNISGTTLVNGDVITFSGTSRSGTSVTGSYTVNNTTTDKVQGLLSAIENAFSNNVTASMDTSGRIVVTDKYSGASELALDIEEPVGKGLDFGTVLKTNTGGQTGRYAMDITASNDGGNHLALTHNSYGSSYSFTISETSDLLWTAVGPEIVNNGTDVTGTIGGETATGSGQMLTGNTGNVNTEGLSVKYTGTAIGDAGTLTLTLGTAELFSRSLFNITDSYEGYVSFKQTSLQNSIDDFETKIDQMEARLALKKERMVKSFVAMETALSSIQNQSSWLAGQISSAEGGWMAL
ncbi:MAG: flagellar filament capping protein FliD [Deltaproteobacteria bacterium]|nr:flagellar filament capping protein FliD [Deltaproteobacteria bacterium]